MTVESSASIGADVEYLRELKGVLIVHIEGASDEDEHAVGNGAGLHVFVVNLIHDLLKSEGLDLLLDLFAANEGISTIGHGASIKVEVNQPLALAHHGGVVLNNKFVSNCFNVHLYEII